MMYDPNYYQTIEASSEAEYNDRGSRFIALSFSVLSIDEFKQKLAEVKTQQLLFLQAFTISANIVF